MDDGWEEVPSKKQLRREQKQRRRQEQEQQHGRGPSQRERHRRPGKGAMAAPAMVPMPLTVVVLVGTPGCGKSTFCAALNEELARSAAIPGGAMPQPVRVSQDDLGGRKACEALSESALRAGHNIVIDRCNFDQPQRSTWLRIGKRFGATVVGAFLNTPIETCKQRVMRRTNHPTLGPTAESMGVIERFRSMLKPPHKSEGFSLVVEAGEDAASVKAAAHTLADHLIAAMVAGLAPEPQPAVYDEGAPVLRSFSQRAMEGLMVEPALSAAQREVAAVLAQQRDGAGATARVLPSMRSNELEQAKLDGEIRALSRLAAATRPTGVAEGGMPAAAPAAVVAATAAVAGDHQSAALLHRTRDEIDRLRSELGLKSAADDSGSSGVASGPSRFNVDAPAWQPDRGW